MNSPRVSLYKVLLEFDFVEDGLEEGDKDQFLALGDGVKELGFENGKP